MPALRMDEIAPSHVGDKRDQFEHFARDFLEAEGFEIVSHPARGPDGGMDLIVRESRRGPGKHKSQTGSSVGTAEEINIRDRVGTHGCNGFIAFYSTLPSSTLAAHIDGLRSELQVLIFDGERIEASLLDSPKGRVIAARYMPISFAKWILSSQYSEALEKPSALPIEDRYFLREPHSELELAKSEAVGRGVGVFIVVFDASHSSRSHMHHCLGYFMEWETTKRLVDEHFVAVVGPSSDPILAALVPEDDPLEECRLVILDRNFDTIRSESLYANPKVGRSRVLESIGMLKNP